MFSPSDIRIDNAGIAAAAAWVAMRPVVLMSGRTR